MTYKMFNNIKVTYNYNVCIVPNVLDLCMMSHEGGKKLHLTTGVTWH